MDDHPSNEAHKEIAETLPDHFDLHEVQFKESNN